jgi:glycosyltransferase involved in cell wall biosynthesis
VEALPAVLARVPDARLAIVGEDFGERSALARRAAQLGVGERVHWLGFLPDDELVAAYRAAAVLVHPSGWEAFGIVLAESLAAGTPVVARRVGGVPWVAPDGECGLLFDRDDELASRVLRVLEDGGLAARLGGAGRERVRTRFGRERQLEALDGLRAELIEARRSGRR